MVTLVGLQTSFASAVLDLIELEYDAKEAYEAAINRLENQEYIAKLKEFLSDHERHINELTSLVTIHQEKAPTGPSGKQWLTKGKVILGNLISDEAILRAMRSNEIDTNAAYDRMSDYDDIWPDAKDFVNKAFADERRHKAWFDKTLGLND
jgi:rubrerythrin